MSIAAAEYPWAFVTTTQLRALVFNSAFHLVVSPAAFMATRPEIHVDDISGPNLFSTTLLGNITNKGICGDDRERNNGGKSVSWSEVARGQMASEHI